MSIIFNQSDVIYNYNKTKQVVSFSHNVLRDIIGSIEKELQVIDLLNTKNINRNTMVSDAETLGRMAVLKELSKRTDILEIFVSVEPFSKWDIGFRTNDTSVIIEIKTRNKDIAFFKRFNPFIEKDKVDFLLPKVKDSIECYYVNVASDGIITWDLTNDMFKNRTLISNVVAYNPVKRSKEVTSKYELKYDERCHDCI